MATALKRTVYTRTSGAAVPTAREPADPALQRFLDAVWMERGLSANTLAAYRADLTALARWFEERDSALLKATRIELLGFIAARVEGGSRPRSTARQLSSFRRFFRFMMREGLITQDPTAQIAMPKIGRSLPKSLTEAEVDSLLEAPTVSEPLGHRDRTMLEVLYATGLRVSELVSLKHNQVNLNQGVMRVVGKGNRERLIPLGDEAVKWLQQFMQGPRVEILLERQTDYLFPTRARRSHDAPGVLAHHQALLEEGGRREGTVAAHLAARLCDAFAESRRGSARGANAPRAQRSVDDPDLHACRSRTVEGPAFPASSAGLKSGLLESGEPLKTRGVEHSGSMEPVHAAISCRFCAASFAPRKRACARPPLSRPLPTRDRR